MVHLSARVIGVAVETATCVQRLLTETCATEGGGALMGVSAGLA